MFRRLNTKEAVFLFTDCFFSDRITVHGGSKNQILVDENKKDYLDAWRVIVTECRRRNPAVRVDKKLLKRLGMKAN